MGPAEGGVLLGPPDDELVVYRPQPRAAAAAEPSGPPSSPVRVRSRRDTRAPLGPWDEEVIDRPIGRFEPTPTAVPEYVPDLVVDGWTAGSLTVRLASVRGYGHRYDGAPRQDDAVACLHHPTGAVLVAVADGVSAAPRSHLGARHAARRAVRTMMQGLDGPGEVQWDVVLDEVVTYLEDLAGRMASGMAAPPASAEELLGTTLVLAVVRPGPDGARVELAQVGDSGAWILGPGGFAPLLQRKTAADAEIVNSAVAALPRRPVVWRHDTATLMPGRLLLLGTDGFGDPLGDGTGLVGDLFAKELAMPPRPLRFAHLLDFSRETFDDDRTLVGIWPSPLSNGRPA